MHCSDSGLGWVAGGISRRIARRIGIDKGIGWVRAAERACARVRPEEVDLILASGSPYSSFVLAERLAKKLARPFVLDYRDPWTKVEGMIPAFLPLGRRLEAR
jgi:hypothetical protein